MKVGEFSRVGHVTVKTLKVYEDLGLLVPASFDEWSGYRAYTPDQLEVLYKILAFRDLGLSLEEIKLLLEKEPTVEHMRGILALRSVQIHNKLDEENHKLALVESLIERIAKEDTMSEYSIIVKDLNPLKVVSIREVLPNHKSIGSQMSIVSEFFGKNKIQSAGSPIAIHHDHEYKDADIDVECAFPFSGSPTEEGKIKVRTLDAGKFASTIHTGPYDTINDAYKAVFNWAESNKYKSNGPTREVYLEKPKEGKGNYVTEIQVPISQ